jgi:hypothetical protein
MNYYAEGGQAHGLKALAQELPKYGRGGDSMVAHINPEEAVMLKAMGGSGTINPTTGLPEFISLGKLNPVKAISNLGDSLGISQAATKVFQPVEKAVVQPVSQGLASFDKAVGNTIPGGWGTLGMIAGSAMGLPAPVMGALGATTGSGVLRPGGKFNLQGAMMGGAMAYGMAELGEYARGAADAVEKAATEGAKSALDPSVIASRDMPLLLGGPEMAPSFGDFAGSLSDPTAGMAGAYTAPAISAVESATPQLLSSSPSIGSQIMSGNFGQAASQAGSNIADGFSNLGTKAVNAYDKAFTADTYSQFGKDRLKDTGDTFSGIKNLLGAGEGTAKEAAAQAAKVAAAEGTMKPMMAAGMTAYGATGLIALDQQRKYLQDQANAGAISQTEYNNYLAEIEKQAEIGRKAVSTNPLQVNPGTEGISEGLSLYGKKGSNETLYDKNPYEGTTLYAMGGAVNPPDDQTEMLSQTPMQRLDTNGVMGYASGGMPRFLSGGGDGMSDSIPANIGGTQEARLADGEFVIPADVVSHIGNGSSKAGAKQLYSMMDRVRQARVGNKKQGKQINPRKYLAA